MDTCSLRGSRDVSSYQPNGVVDLLVFRILGAPHSNRVLWTHWAVFIRGFTQFPQKDAAFGP
jgi:hypothetical protein